MQASIDCSAIDEIRETNARAFARVKNGATDSLDYASLGYTIHNIYGVIENACLRIVKFFENGLPREAWHKELLDRMLLELPGTRPAFFSKETYILLDDLRGFRHVFRNLYSRPLDAERLVLLQRKVPRAVDAFKESVQSYAGFLDKLAGALGA